MSCVYPIDGWRSRHPSPSGKFGITFKRSESNGQKLTVSCGQCVGCRLKRSQEWALRCVHEAQVLEEEGKPSCFVTLTYDDEHLPHDEGLHHEHFQKFIRAVRKRTGEKIRFYMCGEYGEKYGRPHYHAILFGFDFSEDRYKWRQERDKIFYRSDLLEKCWRRGNSEISPFSYQAAGYVARYVMKKVTGEQSEDYYQKVDKAGRLVPVAHEYNRMSIKPGLGHAWYEKYHADLDKDFITHDGRKYPVPSYYDKLREREHSEAMRFIKRKRKAAAARHSDDQHPNRLRQKEACMQARVSRLVRPFE